MKEGERGLPTEDECKYEVGAEEKVLWQHELIWRRAMTVHVCPSDPTLSSK